MWELLLEAFNESGGGNSSLQMIDSTIIRTHYCSAGAKGGLHVRVLPAQKVALRPRSISLGLPIAVALTGGEASDFKGYMPVMDAAGPAPKVLLADKGYDADCIHEDMARRGGIAMIPTKRNRLTQLPVDAAIYALRNMVEGCFNKLKNARRLANRYEKKHRQLPRLHPHRLDPSVDPPICQRLLAAIFNDPDNKTAGFG